MSPGDAPVLRCVVRGARPADPSWCGTENGRQPDDRVYDVTSALLLARGRLVLCPACVGALRGALLASAHDPAPHAREGGHG